MAGIGHRGFMRRKKEPVGLPFIFSVTVGSGQSFQLPTVITGIYDAIIDWGDTTTDNLTSWNDVVRTHTYLAAGTYDIKITGEFVGWSVSNYADRLKIVDVKQWGVLRNWTAQGFFGCSNLVITATDIPVIGANSMAYCFSGCTSLTNIPNVDMWDVSQVGAFGLVTTNSGCFSYTQFNQDISSWDVSSANNFVSMFSFTPFNQNINAWDISNAFDIRYMFLSNTAYNQNMNSWNTGNVQYMIGTFDGASSFDGNISSWDVSSVISFLQFLRNATSFSQDLSTWAVSSLCVSIRVMLQNCDAFSSDLSGWDISGITDGTGFMTNATGLTTPHYDSILISWSGQSPNTLNINFGGSKYTAGGAAEAARNVLINTYGWTISDGGAV